MLSIFFFFFFYAKKKQSSEAKRICISYAVRFFLSLARFCCPSFRLRNIIYPKVKHAMIFLKDVCQINLSSILFSFFFWCFFSLSLIKKKRNCGWGRQYPAANVFNIQCYIPTLCRILVSLYLIKNISLRDSSVSSVYLIIYLNNINDEWNTM